MYLHTERHRLGNATVALGGNGGRSRRSHSSALGLAAEVRALSLGDDVREDGVDLTAANSTPDACTNILTDAALKSRMA